MYGAQETNGLENPSSHHDQWRNAKTVYWTEPGLKIVRLRLLSDPGLDFWDVSYCQGIVNGIPVMVDLPFSQLPRPGATKEIVRWAKIDKVFAKGIGILDNISTLV